VAGRTGRRPGDPAQTRQAILDAAASAFAAHGFEKTSMRMVAGAAGVDPALVHHYFGTKDQLFMATLELPVDPSDIVPQVVTGERDQTGERLVRTFLSVWDSPRGGAMVSVVRSAVAHPWIAGLLRDFVFTRVVLRIFAEVGLEDDPDRDLRATLVASQLIGLAMTRHVLTFEPLASTPATDVVAAIGPTIQRYMFGDITGHRWHAPPTPAA
jgi:AcrR family transcriptional regulator